jgi:hypothetical protein
MFFLPHGVESSLEVSGPVVVARSLGLLDVPQQTGVQRVQLKVQKYEIWVKMALNAFLRYSKKAYRD